MKKFLPTFFFVLILFILLVCVYFVRQVTHVDEGADFPIDLVYLWVDGSDEAWLAKKEYWQRRLGEDKEYAVSKARWRDREELKHSLRSVEEYLPWIRKIFIVTDGQVPSWLNTEHPKIEIVDHKDIFPLDALPVFNSMAIETRLPFIPGLSEHFIYMNDDVFINVPLTPDYFFEKDGTPIVYDDNDFKSENLKRIRQQPEASWAKNWVNQIELVANKFDVKPFFIAGTHTTSAYRKSDFAKALDIFSENTLKTTYSKFRNDSDLERSVIDMTLSIQNRISLKDAAVVNPKFNCLHAGLLIMNNMHDLKENPCTFCLNDTQDLQGEFNLAHTHYLRQRFPKKSSFEK